jgi:hypothetical protein
MKSYTGAELYLLHTWPPHSMEVSGQIHDEPLYPGGNDQYTH